MRRRVVAHEGGAAGGRTGRAEVGASSRGARWGKRGEESGGGGDDSGKRRGVEEEET